MCHTGTSEGVPSHPTWRNLLKGIALTHVQTVGAWNFCLCTPSEFSAIADSWRQREDALNRRSWEQVRNIMMAHLQPYSSKRLRAQDIMKFDWDKKKTPPEKVEKSTRERMEAVKARLKGNQWDFHQRNGSLPFAVTKATVKSAHNTKRTTVTNE